MLYLFLLWVVRSALKDLRRDGARAGRAARGRAAGRDRAARGRGRARPRRGRGTEPRLVVEQRARATRRASAYDSSSGATLGRGDVEIHLEDPFASTRHARIVRQGASW